MQRKHTAEQGNSPDAIGKCSCASCVSVLISGFELKVKSNNAFKYSSANSLAFIFAQLYLFSKRARTAPAGRDVVLSLTKKSSATNERARRQEGYAKESAIAEQRGEFVQAACGKRWSRALLICCALLAHAFAAAGGDQNVQACAQNGRPNSQKSAKARR